MRMKLKECCDRKPEIVQRRLILFPDRNIEYVDFKSPLFFWWKKKGIPERFVYCTYCNRKTINEFDFDNLYLHRQEGELKFYRSKATAKELWNEVENPKGGRIDFIVVDNCINRFYSIRSLYYGDSFTSKLVHLEELAKFGH